MSVDTIAPRPVDLEATIAATSKSFETEVSKELMNFAKVQELMLLIFALMAHQQAKLNREFAQDATRDYQFVAKSFANAHMHSGKTAAEVTAGVVSGLAGAVGAGSAMSGAKGLMQAAQFAQGAAQFPQAGASYFAGQKDFDLARLQAAMKEVDQRREDAKQYQAEGKQSCTAALNKISEALVQEDRAFTDR